MAHWRWVPWSEWQVEGAGKGKTGDNVHGWIYYDTKVNHHPISSFALETVTYFVSGTMDVAAKMAGAVTLDGGNGTVTPSWSSYH